MQRPIRVLARPLCGAAALILLAGACGRPASSNQTAPKTIATTVAPAGPTKTAQPAGWQCPLSVMGNDIITPNGRNIVLHGANVPTLTDMEQSGYTWDDRLRDLSYAGAQVVRLPVKFSELTPTFVPAKVAPFVQTANNLGMIVILVWDATITDPIDDMVDDAEDWLRMEIDYLNNNDGVWFDLYSGMKDVTPTRQRNIAQRLLDVARGFRSHNIIVVTDAVWLTSTDPAINKNLIGGNVVYGLDYSADISATLSVNKIGQRMPFIITNWGDPSRPLSVDLDALKKLDIGNISAKTLIDTPHLPVYLADYWKAKQVNWAICHK
ncbi:MAG: glycoside hydrolase family 5 protein [Chloroflexi bacterium]|nr:glycoside hydrolase family 5 protein [Chloroflexota bacterium]MCL5274457.1 glycoside hydrolase family 5 protein [Chloroflexota bacterium]